MGKQEVRRRINAVFRPGPVATESNNRIWTEGIPVRGTKYLWREEALTAVIVLALFVQAIAGLALRGLYADGAYFVTQITAQQSFVITAPARWTPTVLFELPAVTAIKLGGGTLQRVALIYSLTTNVLPGFIILLCRAALPVAERRFLVFPAFVYFAGILAAQFMSVAETLAATAYVWVLFYLIIFGQFSASRLALIAVLSIGAIRLYEEMMFLGPVLMAGIWVRWRDADIQPARLALGLALVALLASAIVGTYKVWFPDSMMDRIGFVHSDMLRFHWACMPGEGCNSPALLGLAAGIAILACIWMMRVSAIVIATFAAVAAAVACAAFWVDSLTSPFAQMAARHNAALLSFFLMILVLVARFVPAVSRPLTAPPVQAIVIILGLSVSVWHLQATEKWWAFLTYVRTILATNSGIIPPTLLKNQAEGPGAQLATMIMPQWTDLSIIALPRRCVTSIIDVTHLANWQPYDLRDPNKLPQIPELTYAYLVPPDRQASECKHFDKRKIQH